MEPIQRLVHLLGINVSVNPTKIRIGNNNIIGSGTVVLDNIYNNFVVVGVPGKIIKQNKIILNEEGELDN